MGDLSSNIGFLHSLMSSKVSKMNHEDTADTYTSRQAHKAPLKIEGLLSKMSPACRGTLRRKTKFTRSWRTEPDIFEIRSSMLVVYKRRNGSNYSSLASTPISLLDAIFSRATIADLDRESMASSYNSLNSNDGFENSQNSGWNCVIDLSGAVASVCKEDGKHNNFPFKIVFGSNYIEGTSHGTMNLCAESEAQRKMWIAHIEIASKCVSRADFQLRKTIGRGQWGKVFLAKKISGISATRSFKQSPLSEIESEEFLALKEVALSSKTNINHVQNERLIMESVPPHEFVVNMQYAFKTGKFLYYALDFMNGGDLFRHWRQHRDKRSEMTPFYTAEILLALEHLHKNNVVYRDLKPENVLMDSEGHVKLADLGLAKILPSQYGRTNSFCGTEAYLAPEMILRIPYSFSVDFWQFGCFVFELYAGRSPFWLPRKPRKVIRDNILNGSFGYPSSVPEKAKPLIDDLLNINENLRLGSSEGKLGWDSVKKNSFFKYTDWKSFMNRTARPPVIPDDPGPSLCNNFDDDFTSQFPRWGEHPEGNGNDAANAYDDELLGFNFVRLDKILAKDELGAANK
mmetsp:Transcript_12006/g.17948  ORF Transcript_12006/g.17948 Transcript_12006/m.17948 type:complete len:572 (+) Transcript_12006:206-1921(+)